MNPAPATGKTTVYYNSACPVCDAGICFQKARVDGEAVHFVDVHAHPELAQELGIDGEALRERLHVRDAGGALASGDRAFAVLFAQTPGQGWLAWLLRRLSWVAAPSYNALARLLYRWNVARGHW